MLASRKALPKYTKADQKTVSICVNPRQKILGVLCGLCGKNSVTSVSVSGYKSVKICVICGFVTLVPLCGYSSTTKSPGHQDIKRISLWFFVPLRLGGKRFHFTSNN
jgi:hypothetical protein